MHDMHEMNTGHCDMPPPEPSGTSIVEYQLAWPGAGMGHDAPACHPSAGGSTHEIAHPHGGDTFWVSGQNYDHVARIGLDGYQDFFPMPKGSAPHGLLFDSANRLWVSLEGLGQIARVNKGNGEIEQLVDVCLHADGAPAPLNTRPHGIGYSAYGYAIWFTGKLTNTVGRITFGPNLEPTVEHFALPTIGAVPIYIAESFKGIMWCTELVGNAIARITPDGSVTEFAIPTPNSRPIAIVRGPDRNMWFTEEAGGKIGRIDADGNIVEFPIPLTRRDALLAGLAFDHHGALWVQQYCPPGSEPGNDYLVRLAPDLMSAAPGDVSNIGIAYFKVPSKGTVMHRIATPMPDGDIWFTELGLNRIGRLRQ
jgi:virginiamycin B lyase